MNIKKSLVPLSLGGLSIGTTEFIMMGLLPDVATDFGITIPEAGHLISIYALGVVIGAPLLVAFAANYPPRKILLALMSMFVVFNACSAFAPNNTVLLVTRLLSGLPHGAFFGVGSVVASRLADKGKEAQAISVMFAGLTLANLLAVPVGTFIGHTFSWRVTFGIIAGIGLLTVLFIQLWLPEMKVERKGNLKEEMNLFKQPDVWLVILITSIGTGGLFAWISYIAPLLTDVSRFDADKVPYILILAGLGMCIGNFIGGKLADRFSPAATCMAMLLCIALTLIADYFVATSQTMTLIMTFVTGVITFTLGAPIQILMIRTAKHAEMLGASVTQAAFNIGNSLGAFWGGLPIAAGYGFTSPLLVGSIMAVTGAFLCWLLIRLPRFMAARNANA